MTDKFKNSSRQEQTILLLLYAHDKVYPGQWVSESELLKAVSKSGITRMTDLEVESLREDLTNSYEKCVEVVFSCF